LDAIILPFMENKKYQDKFFPELSLIDGLDMREEKIDFLEVKVRDYLIEIAKQSLDNEQVKEIHGLISITTDIEAIADLIHRNLLRLLKKKEEQVIDFSEEGRHELAIYHTQVCNQIKLLERALAEVDLEAARMIMNKERKYLDMELQYEARHLERLFANKTESVQTHEIHMELMDLMKQIVVYSSNIATTFLRAQE